MASRYWVGGSAAWDATAGTKWATTSGGAGGAAVPTAADDVFFDAASGAVTVTTTGNRVCRSLDYTGFTGQHQLGAGQQISIGDASGGGLTLGTGQTMGFNATATLAFVSTSTNGGAGWPITCNGKAPNCALTFSGAGGKWTLQDALSTTGVITHSNGHLDTNSKTVTSSSLLSTSVTTTRVLDLGTTTWTLTLAGTCISIRGTNLTVNGSSGTFLSTGAGATIQGLTNSWNAGGAAVTFTGSGTSTISGTTGIGNLTRTGTAAKTDALVISSGITITGTFTVTGSSATSRVLVLSQARGTSASITAAAVALTNVNFMDITGAGAATWTGTSLGDCLGNSGITFTAPVTRYAVAAGSLSSTAVWSTTSGGAGGASVPLPQDAIVFNGSSAAGTYTNDMPRMGADWDFTGFTRTFDNSLSLEVFGSVTLGAGMTFSGSSDLFLTGRGSHTFTPNGITVTNRLTMLGPGGTYTLGGNITLSRATVAALRVQAGTLNDGGFNVAITHSASFFQQTGGALVASGVWTFSATGAITFWDVTAGTVTHSGTITLAAASASTRTFAGFGQTYGTLTYTVAGSTGQLNITGSNTFATINFSDATNARSLLFTAGTTTTVTTWNVVGTAGKLMTVGSITAAAHTLVNAGGGIVSADYLSISQSQATGGLGWYAGANSTDGGNNTGWIFAAAPPAGSIDDMLLLAYI